MTKIQESILNTVSQTSGHMTAEQILDLVRQLHPTASLSTVYRNLNIFAETGKIRRIQRATGSDYYDKNLDPHDHAYCAECGRIIDVKIPELKDFLARNFEYHIRSFNLVINFVCPECAE